MGERTAEVGAINVRAFFLRNVDVFALGAVDFDSRVPEVFGHTDWQNILTTTKNPWTDPEGAVQKFFAHHGKTPRREDVSGVD